MINFFPEKSPQHHGFYKGEKPKSIKQFKPFVSEKNIQTGKQVDKVYLAYRIEFESCVIEVWSDDDNNCWTQLVE